MRRLKNVLITGISGSGASYLAEYILAKHKDVKIVGISRWHSTISQENIKSIKDKIEICECDLLDFSSVFATLRDSKPDAIFHLASYANVATAFLTPISVLNNNVGGTINLLEAVHLAKIDPLIQICSTSEVYGQVDPKDVPINENCPMRPVNIYGVSKATQELLGFAYFKSLRMKIVITRMFAYINPRREDLFASSFAKQVAQIEVGKRKELAHGNLDSVRTLIDVRDAMQSYWVAATRCRVGEVYNIGGTKVIKVGDFLDVLKKLARCKVKTRLDRSLLRPTDVTLQIPNTGKFRKETGWKPKYSFEQSVAFLLNYWRERIARENEAS